MPPTRLHEDEFEIDASLVRAILAGQLAFPYYLHSNPAMVATARRGIGEALTDSA